MVKWKDFDVAPSSRKEKRDCKHWEWFGIHGCRIKNTKFCKWCLLYEKGGEK